MFGLGLFDVEKQTRETIKTALEEVAIELNCSHKEFFVMIQPVDASFEMKFFIHRIFDDKAPQRIREISLAEILGKE